MSEEEILQAARQLPAFERTRFLEETCGGDSDQLNRIQSRIRDEESADKSTLQSSSSPPGEEVGSQVGPYKLLQRIGTGAFGIVFMAEQRSPIVRRVALKIIRQGMDTEQVIARFEAERQALAMMNHPNIAKVLDAGTTQRGRPYFVMELVRGIPITEFCDEHRYDLRARLDLFCDLCSAVQHAHQKGIIHRDLKPSNILVARDSDKPIAKIIDFGIAKATQQQLTEKTLFTRFEQFVGTPLYVSPEQASMSVIDIDTRADIYSLGILLYELVTGKPPVDPKDLVASGFDEMRKRIREEEPPKPSVRFSSSTASELEKIGKARNSDPRKLELTIKGDLDWIILKTIEKERDRRYETANGLSMDIRRFLENEPVAARPPSFAYLTRKYVQRHKGPLIAGATVALVLVLGVIASTILAIKAMNAEENLRKNFALVEKAKKDAEDLLLDLRESEKERLAEVTRRIEEEEMRKSVDAIAQREKERADDLNEKIGESLSFLRSREIREELQKSNPDGLKIIQLIDERIGRLFLSENRIGDQEFLTSDLNLALELSAAAVKSLDASLHSAALNYENALSLLDSLEESEAPAPYALRRAEVLMDLARLDRWMGKIDTSTAHLARFGALRGEADGVKTGREATSWHRLQARALLESVYLSQLMNDGEAGEEVRQALVFLDGIGLSNLADRDLQLREIDALTALAAETSGDERNAGVDRLVKAIEDFRGKAEPKELDSELSLLNAELAVLSARAHEMDAVEVDSIFAALESDLHELLENHPQDRRLLILQQEILFRLGDHLSKTGLKYVALELLRHCNSLSSLISAKDPEFFYPLDYKIRSSHAIASIYESDKAFGRQLDFLQSCSDAIETARRQGMTTMQYESQFSDLDLRMIEATVRSFYVFSATQESIEENSFYAEEVTYFGRKTPRIKILDDQKRYREVYPMRFYEVKSLEASRLGDGQYEVVADVEYWVAKKKAGRINTDRPDGRNDFIYRLEFDKNNRPKITYLAKKT